MAELAVGITTFNSEKSIASCLQAIQNSDFKDYELLVVDDHSTDRSVSVAVSLTKQVISFNENRGRSSARNAGFKSSRAPIFISIDSDILIRPWMLRRIKNFLDENPGISAITGLLSKEHPNPDFFSQYKNLYMNYVFSWLPEQVNFIYGSIFAVRREAFVGFDEALHCGEDTEFGLRLAAQGGRIALLKDLEVVHLKKYNLLSFFKNDFNVPFCWAHIKFQKNSTMRGGKKGQGFAHARASQLFAIATACATMLSALMCLSFPQARGATIVLGLAWAVLNARFILFLSKERGLLFGLGSFFVTFLDQLTMAAGIVCGTIHCLIQTATKR